LAGRKRNRRERNGGSDENRPNSFRSIHR
jgi:hypothetical protein